MYTAPHYYLTVAVGMDELLAARARLNAGREKKISVNAFLMAIAGRALARHPRVNSSWNGETLLQHPSADIGLAVALPDGLITPVVRDCGRKGIAAIDAELADLVDRARAGKLAPPEYAGRLSRSAISGPWASTSSPPSSTRRARRSSRSGAVRKEPVVENDAVVIRQRMRVTLSCDHRIIDGAVGAAFLRELADMLENPLLAWHETTLNTRRNTHGRLRLRRSHHGLGPGRIRGGHQGRPARAEGGRHRAGQGGRGLPECRLHPLEDPDPPGGALPVPARP